MRESTNRGGAEKEGDTESEAVSRLQAVSTESDVGLELMNHEIMTRAKVGHLTDWATQVPFLLFLKKRNDLSLGSEHHIHAYLGPGIEYWWFWVTVGRSSGSAVVGTGKWEGIRVKRSWSAKAGPVQKQADPLLGPEGLQHLRTWSPSTLTAPPLLSHPLMCFISLLLMIHSDSLPMLCLLVGGGGVAGMAQMFFGKLHNANSVLNYEAVLNFL